MHEMSGALTCDISCMGATQHEMTQVSAPGAHIMKMYKTLMMQKLTLNSNLMSLHLHAASWVQPTPHASCAQPLSYKDFRVLLARCAVGSEAGV